MSTRLTIHQASRIRIGTGMSGLNIHIHTILTFTIAIHIDRVHYADEEELPVKPTADDETTIGLRRRYRP